MVQSESLQIYWHDSHPIYSLCFQPVAETSQNTRRLFTSGGDNKIRVWELNEKDDKIDTIDFLSSLSQHEQAVNVCRFNNQGDILATAGDDGLLLLWKRNETMVKDFGVDEDEFQDYKESWAVWKRLRSGSASNAEIYDISWNPQGTCIAIASLDNSVRVFDVAQGKVVGHISEHNHYVQGIVWDPQGEFVISQSADRSLVICNLIYEDNEIKGLQLVNKILKAELPRRIKPGEKELDFEKMKVTFLFHNETLPSFFRRPCMSPCGSILCVPAGVFRNDEQTEAVNNNPEYANAVYIYTRASLTSNLNKPVFSLPFLQKPALVVKFNPLMYEKASTWVLLPYTLVFAVATTNEVLVYDTNNTSPIVVIGNLHYTPITDLAWSQDGKLLMISSADGFCSYINFPDNDFGSPLTDQSIPKIQQYLEKKPPSSKNASSDKLNDTTVIIDSTAVATGTANVPNPSPTTTPTKRSISQLVSAAANNVGKEKLKRRVQPTLVTSEQPDEDHANT
ncbi:unnamed protein product [Kluyveromyces dobzhanskii CBS 2104]|uniref:WGS project CCBQ000000000 data, contig 00014 n=1 Tax=Kluyveromyces dobzhanskii CBS 2104 TaxID=1427455 RepID=A0A0A8L997_9SACH|nr:unnamed protein product [Kluyveromyces dobzhanskii CBS 2104]